jgi:hypothetical protein
MPARCSPVHGLAAALSLLLACGGETASTAATEASAGNTTALTDGIDPAPTTSTTTTAAPTTTGDTASDTDDSTTGAAPTFCAQLDISLVAHPGLDIYGPEPRAALAAFLADMVESTGARVRLLANAGTEVMLKTDCLLPLGNAADDPILVYGEGGVVDPEAPVALECLMDALDIYKGEFDNGDFMFSGLLFPVLDLESWPAPGATGLALMLAKDDDEQDNMYAQPGLAAEAYLRIVGEQDRRRVATLTYGDVAGKLEIFGLAVSEHSRHYERSKTTLPAALADWTPIARQVCEDFDYQPPFEPLPPPGCKRVDILFAIDGSGSMDEEQAALRGTNGMAPVFAEFTDALLAELTDVEDFHVGVVSSQEEVTLLGTHTNFPEVPESPETDCGLPPGQRWLVGPSPTLAEDFACIAATRSGTDEVTAYNTAEALHNPANAGFLREDSLVFAVLLTDEDTYDFNIARMVDIRARLLSAVGDDLDRLIVLGIAGGQGVFEAPETICEGPYGKAVPARRIASIVASLRERGRMQNICKGDLASTFKDVLGDVVSACLAYDPVP